jgi:papain like protease/PKD domain-containing protein
MINIKFLNMKLLSFLIILIMLFGLVSTNVYSNICKDELKSNIIIHNYLNKPYTQNLTEISKWDWRNAEYNNIIGDWTSPVKDQGLCNCSWAFSTISLIESVINIREGVPYLDLDFSEQYLLSCMKDEILNSKPTPSDAFDFIIENKGIIPEFCFPYQADYNVPCENKTEDWMMYAVKIIGYNHLKNPTIDEIKSYLIECGPFSTYFDVYEDFLEYPSWWNRGQGIYRYDHGNYSSKEWITIIGFNDEENYWICKGSKGIGWIEKGCFRIGYGECNIEKDIYSVNYDPDLVELPPVAFCGGLYSASKEEQIVFNSNASFDVDNDIVKYEWNFGDGFKSDKKNPTHTYSNKGLYNVELIIIDSKGNIGKDNTAVFIDLWDVDSRFVYSLSIDGDWRKHYDLPIDFRLDLNNTIIDIKNETKEEYIVSISGKPKAELFVDLYRLFEPDLPFHIDMIGDIKWSDFRMDLIIEKPGFSIKQIDFYLSSMVKLRFNSIPIYFPLNIKGKAYFNPPLILFGFAPELNKQWYSIKSECVYSSEMDIYFGLFSYSYSENFSVPFFNEIYPHICIGTEEIMVGAGCFNTYVIEIIDGLMTYYYSPELSTIVKIETNDDIGLLSIYGELISIER